MFERFLHDNFSLFDKKKLVVAVSGGQDSMVLTHLLQTAKVDLVVVHIDHGTRKGISSQDALFVQRYCKENNIDFYSNTYNHTAGNFQAEARNFRYNYLEEVMRKTSSHYIVTAHHQDDAIESFLNHSFRGSGSKGLRGITQLDGIRLRPFINFTRKEIEEFSRAHCIPYVEDQSNESDVYSRNRIRNELIPVVDDIFPGFKNSMKLTMANIEADYNLLKSLVHEKLEKNITREGSKELLDISKIKTENDASTLLYHYLSPLGFSKQQIHDALDSTTGSIFFTEKQVMNKDRDRLIITNRSEKIIGSYMISKVGANIRMVGHTIQIIPYAPSMEILTTDILLKTNKLTFPLELRTWREGDRFQPSGMKGQSKKISKLLKDLKIPLIDKALIMVLLSGNTICCVPGIRADHRFMADPKDENKLIVRLIDYDNSTPESTLKRP